LCIQNRATMTDPTSAPSSVITPWLVGETTITPITFFSEPLIVNNPIGLEVDALTLKLFEYDCLTEVTDTTDSALSLTNITVTDNISEYAVVFDSGNFASDTGFVDTDGSTGTVKWCTRITSIEGDLQISFKETNFMLNYDLTDNQFEILGIGIEEGAPDDFTEDIDSDYEVRACQCMDFFCMNPEPVSQNEALVYCIYVWQEQDNMDAILAVEISNFDSKMSAGEMGDDDYFEYVPVEFGSTTWEPNELTVVTTQFDGMGNIVEVRTPVVATFFSLGHEEVNISGNAFLEFIADGAFRTDDNEMREYVYDVALQQSVGLGCFKQLLSVVTGTFI